MFKVGDRVVVVADTFGDDKAYVGKCGTVDSHALRRATKLFDYGVIIDGNNHVSGFDDNELALVEE